MRLTANSMRSLCAPVTSVRFRRLKYFVSKLNYSLKWPSRTFAGESKQKPKNPLTELRIRSKSNESNIFSRRLMLMIVHVDSFLPFICWDGISGRWLCVAIFRTPMCCVVVAHQCRVYAVRVPIRPLQLYGDSIHYSDYTRYRCSYSQMHAFVVAL